MASKKNQNDSNNSENTEAQESKSDAQLMQETKAESYVQGEEVKGLHLQGEEVEGGTKADSIKRKLAGKKAARDGGEPETDSYGRPVQEIIVHPHREKQPHRIEQEFPEVEIVYGAMDPEKQELLAEAHSKGIFVDHAQDNEELRSEIDRVDGDRQAQLDSFETLEAQVLYESKAYYNNQLLNFEPGQVVQGDLAQRLIDQKVAQEVDSSSK